MPLRHRCRSVATKGGDVQGTREERTEEDPLAVPVQISRGWDAAEVADLPSVFTGGWVGFTGYDTVRYTYPKKIGFAGAPRDDRGLLDMHLALYKDTVVFDSATKLIYCVAWAEVREGASVEDLYEETRERVRAFARAFLGPVSMRLCAESDAQMLRTCAPHGRKHPVHLPSREQGSTQQSD